MTNETAKTEGTMRLASSERWAIVLNGKWCAPRWTEFPQGVWGWKPFQWVESWATAYKWMSRKQADRFAEATGGEVVRCKYGKVVV